MPDIDRIIEQQFEKQHDVLDNLRAIHGEKFADSVAKTTSTITIIYVAKRDAPQQAHVAFDYAAECVLMRGWVDSGHKDLKEYTDAIGTLSKHIHVVVNPD